MSKQGSSESHQAGSVWGRRLQECVPAHKFCHLACLHDVRENCLIVLVQLKLDLENAGKHVSQTEIVLSEISQSWAYTPFALGARKQGPHKHEEKCASNLYQN